MLDPSEMGSGSDCEDINMINNNNTNSNGSPSSNEIKRTCVDCGTTKTPLWRGGPAGPKRIGDKLKRRLMELGKEVLMQRSTVEKQRRKQLREEEQAAVLLMALSYGSAVYA
ncbi:hypothetical protein ACFE04_013716 [Oxalis oulophora]